MTFMRTLVTALATLTLLGEASAQQPTGRLQVEGAYTQAASGMTFPTLVGDFQRVSVVRYAEDGSDESAGYNRTGENGLITATVYIYPSPSILSVGSPRAVIEDARNTMCARQVEAVRSELSSAHRRLQEIEAGAASLIQGEQTYAGQQISFRVTSPSGFGPEHPPLRTTASLFCYVGGRWTVKYRITYRADSSDAAEQTAMFMRDLAITIPPEDWDGFDPVRRSGKQ
jgi:hypothetical protein